MKRRAKVGRAGMSQDEVISAIKDKRIKEIAQGLDAKMRLPIIQGIEDKVTAKLEELKD